MTSQLDERSAQTVTSLPEQNEPTGRPSTWLAATIAVAGLALGAGLIVTATGTDGVPTPVDNAEQTVEQANPITAGTNAGGLPPHLQEFEAGTRAAAAEAAADRSAYQIIKDEIDKALAKSKQASIYEPPPPEILRDEIDIALARDAAKAVGE